MNRQLVKCQYKTDLYDLSLHFHNDYEMMYVTDGEAQISVDGMQIHTKKGDILFLNKNANHDVRITKAPYNRYVAIISSDGFEKRFGGTDLFLLFKHSPNHYHHCINATNFYNITLLFNKIISESKGEPDNYTTTLLASYLQEILIYAWRLSKDKFIINDDIKSKVLKVQNILEKDYSLNITIDQICKELYISTYYLTRSFTKYIGISPKQYLLHIRLNNAGKLLKNTSMPIAEIAEKSGFQTTSNFIAYFKKHFGVTPKKFRNIE